MVKKKKKKQVYIKINQGLKVQRFRRNLGLNRKHGHNQGLRLEITNSKSIPGPNGGENLDLALNEKNQVTTRMNHVQTKHSGYMEPEQSVNQFKY